MKTAMMILCFCLISASTHAQSWAPIEPPPVFDKKFWVVTGVMIGSSIMVTEASVRTDPNNQSDRRLKIYTVQGISNFLIFAVSANMKSNESKWWWVAPIALSTINGGLAVKFSKSF